MLELKQPIFLTILGLIHTAILWLLTTSESYKAVIWNRLKSMGADVPLFASAFTQRLKQASLIQQSSEHESCMPVEVFLALYSKAIDTLYTAWPLYNYGSVFWSYCPLVAIILGEDKKVQQ